MLFLRRRFSQQIIIQKKKDRLCDLFLLVETTGIEPVTPCMSSKYSNQLSYASEQKYYSTTRFEMQ